MKDDLNICECGMWKSSYEDFCWDCRQDKIKKQAKKERLAMTFRQAACCGDKNCDCHGHHD